MSGKPPRGQKTAAELMAELEANPDYVAARQRRDADHERNEAEWRQAEAPLVEELRSAGIEVESAWDLVNTLTPYPQALPILLRHLEGRYPDRVREGIARALAVSAAQFGWETLARLYRDEPAGSDAKAGLAAALAAAADDAVAGELIELARNPVHGDSRLLLLRGLARSSAPPAREALAQLCDDQALGHEARRLLAGER